MSVELRPLTVMAMYCLPSIRYVIGVPIAAPGRSIEASSLPVALSNATSRAPPLDPINEPERSRARWFQVGDRLEEEGKVTPLEALALEDFVLPSRVKTLPDRAFERTYFSEALRDYLLNKSDVLGATYEER